MGARMTQAALAAMLVLALSSCDLLAGLTQPAVAPAREAASNPQGIVVVGEFTGVASHATRGIARLDLDGSVDPDFAVQSDAIVLAVEPVTYLGKPALAIGGMFTSIGGVARTGLALIDPGTGALITEFDIPLAWSGGDPRVYAIEYSEARNSIFVGGRFDGTATHASPGVVEIDLSTEAANPTFTSTLGPQTSGAAIVWSVAMGHGEIGGFTLAVGGQFVAHSDANGTFYAFAIIDSSGKVVGYAPPAMDDSSAVFHVVAVADTNNYSFAGSLVPSTSAPPTDIIVHAQAYLNLNSVTATAGVYELVADTSELEITAASAALGTTRIRSATRLATGQLVLGSDDNLVFDSNSLGIALIAPIVASTGLPDTTQLIDAPSVVVSDPFAYHMRTRGIWTYASGSFDLLVDSDGTTVTTPFARFDSSAQLDPSFAPAFVGTFGPATAAPVAYDFLFLPPGF